ncbi:MAG: phosphotransferase, partial [Clostridia bacterium]|nr:phosphotransferase [Clostridia bacterium]
NLSAAEITDYHRSGDKVYNVANKYILKVSTNIQRLQNELEKDAWVSQYIVAPKPVQFVVESEVAYYLRERLQGDNLCSQKYLNRPLVLIDLLAEAVKTLHSTKVDDKKYLLDDNYATLVHGDFCLPNILAQDDKIVGYIDLGDAGIGDPWMDYAWCIWSLEYNLGTKQYTPLLLEKLGIQFDQEKFKKYTN